MGDDVHFLLTFVIGTVLVKYVLCCKLSDLPSDIVEYPMEPKSREYLLSLMPGRFSGLGPIVAVERIADVHVAQK
jgi:hypothetical protein